MGIIIQKTNMDNFMKTYGKPEAEQKMSFGKYKGLTFDEVWEKDKPYVAYMLKFRDTENEKFYKRPIAYFVEKIEREFRENGE